MKKRYLSLAIIAAVLLSACGAVNESSSTTDNNVSITNVDNSNLDADSIDPDSSVSESSLIDFPKEKEQTDYKYKTTEELLSNEKNIASDGYVIILDTDDIPEYMRDIIVPFRDSDSNLYGYKNLMGDIIIEPQYYIASDFADNNLAYIRLFEGVDEDGVRWGGNPLAIRSDGSFVTDPENTYVSWIGNNYIKYYSITDEGLSGPHIVNENLEELNVESYFNDYPAKEKLDISSAHLGYDNYSHGINEIAYGKYQNGFLPYSEITDWGITSGLLDDDGNIVVEYEYSNFISSVSEGYYVVMDDTGYGCIYDDSHNAVTGSLFFTIGYTERPTEKVIYPGGYTYAYFSTANGTTAYVIKIDPELSMRN